MRASHKLWVCSSLSVTKPTGRSHQRWEQLFENEGRFYKFRMLLRNNIWVFCHHLNGKFAMQILHCSPVLCLFACSCSCGGIYITCHILIFFGVLLFKLHQIYVCVSFLPPFGFIECQHVIGGRTVCLRLTWNKLLSLGRDKLCPQQQSHPLAKQWHTIT